MTPGAQELSGAFMPLVGSPMANRSEGRGQTKGGSEDANDEQKKKVFRVPRPDVSHRGPPLEPGLGLGLMDECLVAGPSPMGPGQAQPEKGHGTPLPQTHHQWEGTKG